MSPSTSSGAPHSPGPALRGPHGLAASHPIPEGAGLCFRGGLGGQGMGKPWGVRPPRGLRGRAEACPPGQCEGWGSPDRNADLLSAKTSAPRPPVHPPTFKSEPVFRLLFSRLLQSPPPLKVHLCCPAVGRGRGVEWGGGRGSGWPLLPLPLAKQAQGWGGPRGPLLVPPSPRSRQPLGPALQPGTWFGSAELGSWPRATNL